MTLFFTFNLMTEEECVQYVIYCNLAFYLDGGVAQKVVLFTLGLQAQ